MTSSSSWQSQVGFLVIPIFRRLDYDRNFYREYYKNNAVLDIARVVPKQEYISL